MGREGRTILHAMFDLALDVGQVKLDEGWRPGAKSLGLDVVALLTPRTPRRRVVVPF
jgi:hypothetical protein